MPLHILLSTVDENDCFPGMKEFCGFVGEPG
jgi:hypothetical protein